MLPSEGEVTLSLAAHIRELEGELGRVKGELCVARENDAGREAQLAEARRPVCHCGNPAEVCAQCANTLRAEVAEARRLLIRMEWDCYDGVQELPFCSLCGRRKCASHAEPCSLVAFLAATAPKPEAERSEP